MLENYWYIVARSKGVNKNPVSAMLFGRPLVVFRTRNNDLAVLEDRCAHRNSPLSQGKICGDAIQCPYHGWEYNRDGSLNSLPALDQNDYPDINVKSYPCIEQDGYVWTCTGNKPATETPLLFPNLRQNGWTSFHMKTEFKAPVEQCLENFLDCPHATFVHNSWFRSPLETSVRTQIKSLPDGAEVEYSKEPRKKSIIWWGLQNSSVQMKHTDRFIAPSTSRVDYIFSDQKHYIITSSCSPRDVTNNITDVYTVITFKYKYFGWLVRLFFEPLSRFIIKQDVNIMQKQRWNIDRFGKEQFCISKADLLIPYIKKWRDSLNTGALPNTSEQTTYQNIIL